MWPIAPRREAQGCARGSFCYPWRVSKRRTPTARARRIPTVLISIDTATTWGRRIVSGVLDHAQAHGPWHVLLEPSGLERRASRDAAGDVDGVIARIGSQAEADWLRARGIPAVNVSSIPLRGTAIPRVITNQRASASVAADHFRARGFSNFAYVGNPTAGYVQTQFAYFSEVLAEGRQSCAFFAQSDDARSLKRWLRDLPKPCGVFCWGPSLGRQVIDACLDSGLRVPDDVAVLGSDFDDLISRASYPPQSGVRYACEQIGGIAAGILMRLLKGESAEEHEVEIEPLGVVETLSTDTLAVGDRRMAEAMRFILRNFERPIGMRELLRANPMSRRSMERRFRRVFGCTVVEQIRRQRVNRARLLLTSTDDPITLIAEKCGFSSYNYMSRVFAEVVGMSPREFRARSRPLARP
jgi:LacI family transcriptional regulator